MHRSMHLPNRIMPLSSVASPCPSACAVPSRAMQNSRFRSGCAWGRRRPLHTIRSGFLLATTSCRKPPHDRVQGGLPLETDPGPIRYRDVAVLKVGVVGEPAEGAEYAGIGFRTAQSKTGGDGERHLIAAVREQCAARPAVAFEHGDGARVLHDAVGLRRVD